MRSPSRTPRARALAAVTALAAAACAGDPEGAYHLWVGQAGSSSLSAVDPASGVVVRRVEVGLLPHELLLSRDGTRLYAVLVGSQAIAEVDVRSGALLRTFLTAPVPLAREDGTPIAGHQDGEAGRRTSCFDCHGRPGGPAPRYVGERPFAALLSDDGRRLLVAHLRTGVVSELDLERGAIVRRVPLAPAGEAGEPVALARLGAELFVALRPRPPATTPGAIRRLHPETLAPLGEVATGADPGALLALPGRGALLASNFEADTVTELRGGEAVRHAAAPGPLGLLDLGDGRSVLVLDYYSNAVTRLDLATGTARTAPLADARRGYANPTHAALAPGGRVAWVVSSGTEGHLLAVDPESLAVERAVPIDGLSFDVLAVPGPPPSP